MLEKLIGFLNSQVSVMGSCGTGKTHNANTGCC